ncbi:MAG TPA: LacI family DNA-binding transcriptional regulator [Chthoniobacterales bacterium]|jgi:DNA-binding LacI/PurR family transcriptional regulator
MKSSIHTTAQLAEMLGVSRWTISRALNHQSGLNEGTAEKIRAAAREHGFTPNILGRGLRAGKTDLIGICVPDLVDYFLTNKISRLREAVALRGFHPVMQIINAVPAEENAALERFAAMRCGGVVTIASRLHRSDPSLRRLHSSGIPVVQIDPINPERQGSVTTDRQFAMRLAVEHFHDFGHRQLVAMGFNLKNSYGRQRIRGLLQACHTHGWDFRNDIVWLDWEHAGDDFERGELFAGDYLALKDRPTAILAINDRVALGAMHQLQKAGLHVPVDVSILGYDNADFCSYTTPSLSSVDPQVGSLIEHAVEMLLPLAPREIVADGKSLRIQPRLAARESTGSAPTSTASQPAS